MNELVEQLGTKPDNQLSKEFGFSREWIRVLRKRRGIPPFEKKTLASEARKTLKPDDFLCNTLEELAEKHNVSRGTLRCVKKSMNLTQRLSPKTTRIINEIQKYDFMNMTDKQLEAVTGIPWRRIQAARLRSGIKRFERKTGQNVSK